MCKGSTGRGERNKKNSRRETKVTIANVLKMAFGKTPNKK